MKPEQKAREILNKIEGTLINSLPHADEPYMPETIKIGIICVDEIIEIYSHYTGMYDQDFFDSDKAYWKKVKEEIQKL